MKYNCYKKYFCVCIYIRINDYFSNITSLIPLLNVTALDFSQYTSLIKKIRGIALSPRFVHVASFTKRYQ